MQRQLKHLEAQEYLGKFNGAVGNFNAHAFAYPEVDWIEQSRGFVESLGLVWNPLTTQIESHDFIAEMFETMSRIDTILLGFCRDMWAYISIGYFRQRSIKGETGSSVMPHKVNPIDFENAEGNLRHRERGVRALAPSCRSRDGSAICRTARPCARSAPAFGHVMVALSSLEKGLSKIEINQERIAQDIDAEESWEVVAEAIQTLLRRHGYPRPYEA